MEKKIKRNGIITVTLTKEEYETIKDALLDIGVIYIKDASEYRTGERKISNPELTWKDMNDYLIKKCTKSQNLYDEWNKE